MTDTIQQKDTTFTKIFVGGLPYHTTDKSLREFFETFGEIEEAVVITDRQTGKSRGYGFVTMADKQAAERACKDANPIIDGRKANVNLAYIGAKPRGNGQHAFPIQVRAGYPAFIQGQYGPVQVRGRLPSDLLTSHDTSLSFLLNNIHESGGQHLEPRSENTLRLHHQYIYPSPYIATTGMILPSHSPLSPSAAAAGQYYDYSAAFASQYGNGYDTYPYASSPGYITPAYPYSIPTIPAGATGHFAHYPPQPQIQDARLQ